MSYFPMAKLGDAHAGISNDSLQARISLPSQNPNCLQVVACWFFCNFFSFAGFLLQHMSHLARSLWPGQGYENNHKAIAQVAAAFMPASSCPVLCSDPQTPRSVFVALISLEC